MAEANARLSHIERIKRFVLIGEEWTPQSGQLTPTLKQRRSAVLNRYAEEIAGMYADPPAGIEVTDPTSPPADTATVPAPPSAVIAPTAASRP